jgi:hypothetical protein
MGLKNWFPLTSRRTESHAMPRQQSNTPEAKPAGGDYQRQPGFVGNVLANIRSNVGPPANSVAELQRRDQAAAGERHRNQLHPILGAGQRTALGSNVTGGPGRVAGQPWHSEQSTQAGPGRFVGRAAPQRGAPQGRPFNGMRDFGSER